MAIFAPPKGSRGPLWDPKTGTWPQASGIHGKPSRQTAGNMANVAPQKKDTKPCKTGHLAGWEAKNRGERAPVRPQMGPKPW